MGKNCSGLVLVVIFFVLASCYSDSEQLKIKDNKGELSISITTTKSFTKDQQIKLYNDSTFKLSATFGYDLKSVSYGIDGEFTVSQVAPNGNSWSQDVTLDPINTTNGFHTLKVIGTPKMDGVSTEQVMKFEVIDKPALSIKYDRKNTATKQPIKVTTSSPLETITMILPDGSRQPFKKQSPTSFSLDIVIPKGEKGLCRIQSTDEYGNSVTELLFVDMAEKRLWFINSGWDIEKQRSYHQLISCNTDLQDVVVHMDTDEFLKLSYDKEDDEQIKLYGGKGQFYPMKSDLQGITPDKRYIAFTCRYAGVSVNVKDIEYGGIKNWSLVDLEKYSFIIFDTQKRSSVFRRSKYITKYGASNTDQMSKEPGSKIFPLFMKDDKFYLLEQIKGDDYVRNINRNVFLSSTDCSESPFATTKIIEFSFSDYSYKYIEPRFKVTPWVTFNVQDIGVMGFSDNKFIDDFGMRYLPDNANDCFSSLNVILDENNHALDMNNINNALIGKDKFLNESSGICGVVEISNEPIMLYTATFGSKKDRDRSRYGYKSDSQKQNVFDLDKHYYVISIVTGETKEVKIEKPWNRFLFVRTNPVKDGKGFFYLHRERYIEPNSRKRVPEAFSRATFDGRVITLEEIIPDAKIDWLRQLSVFYQ